MVYLQSPYLNANESFEHDAPEKELLAIPEQDDVGFLQAFHIFILYLD